MNPKFCSLLGLAMRAGKLKFGEDSVLENIRNQQAQLVLISLDASPATLKKMTDKCTYYQVEWRTIGTREQLGACIGKEARVSLCIMDKGFADAIRKTIEIQTD